MSIFHRLEDYGHGRINGLYVVISFDTEHRGIWQCRWNEDGMSEYTNEPPFETLRKYEQEEIERVAVYVFYTTHGELPNI